MDPVYRNIGTFFTTDDIHDANKKGVILDTVIGPKAYKLLRSLVAPERLEDKSYTDLVGAMKKHHNPEPSEIMQRHKFFRRFRQQGESISAFMSELRALPEFCNFGTFLDIMLRDRLVCGVNDSHIQCRLPLEPILILDTAMKIALGVESAAQNAITLQGSGEASAASSGEVLKFTRTKPGSGKQQIPSCARCGKSGHQPSKCRFKDAKCHHCGKVGHIKPACLQAQSRGADKTVRIKGKNVNTVQESAE